MVEKKKGFLEISKKTRGTSDPIERKIELVALTIEFIIKNKSIRKLLMKNTQTKKY